MISKSVELLTMSKEVFESLNSFELGSIEFIDKYEDLMNNGNIHYCCSFFDNKWTDYFVDDYDKPIFMSLTKEQVERFLADAKSVLEIQFTDEHKSKLEFERIFCNSKNFFIHQCFFEDTFIELQQAYYHFRRLLEQMNWNDFVLVLNV